MNSEYVVNGNVRVTLMLHTLIIIAVALTMLLPTLYNPHSRVASNCSRPFLVCSIVRVRNPLVTAIAPSDFR